MKRMKKLLIIILVLLNIVPVCDSLQAMRPGVVETKSATPGTSDVKEFPMHDQITFVRIILQTREPEYVHQMMPKTTSTVLGESYKQGIERLEVMLEDMLRVKAFPSDLSGNLDPENHKTRGLFIQKCVGYIHSKLHILLSDQLKDIIVYEINTTCAGTQKIIYKRKVFDDLMAAIKADSDGHMQAEHGDFLKKFKKLKELPRDKAKIDDLKQRANAEREAVEKAERDAAERAEREAKEVAAKAAAAQERTRREHEKSTPSVASRGAGQVIGSEEAAAKIAAEVEAMRIHELDNARSKRRKDRCKKITETVVGGSIEAILYGLVAYSIHDAIQTGPVMPEGVVNKASDCVIS